VRHLRRDGLYGTAWVPAAVLEWKRSSMSPAIDLDATLPPKLAQSQRIRFTASNRGRQGQIIGSSWTMNLPIQYQQMGIAGNGQHRHLLLRIRDGGKMIRRRCPRPPAHARLVTAGRDRSGWALIRIVPEEMNRDKRQTTYVVQQLNQITRYVTPHKQSFIDIRDSSSVYTNAA
jgi:hypothetical protein